MLFRNQNHYLILIKIGPNRNSKAKADSCGNNMATKLKQEIHFDNTHFPLYLVEKHQTNIVKIFHSQKNKI